MKVKFIEESDEDLITRTDLYIDPESELSVLLTKLQDVISESEDIDRSDYKYVNGKLCKFKIELISDPDLALLSKRKSSVEKLTINLNKIKWELTGNTYNMKIGKIQDKDLYIEVAVFQNEVEDPNTIREIKDFILKSEILIPEPPTRIKSIAHLSSTSLTSSSVSAVTSGDIKPRRLTRLPGKPQVVAPPQPVVAPIPYVAPRITSFRIRE